MSFMPNSLLLPYNAEAELSPRILFKSNDVKVKFWWKDLNNNNF